MAMCSTREDCSLAAFTEGSSCEMASLASLARDVGPKLEVSWDSSASHSLKDPPREICVRLEDFSANFGDHRNKYYNAGQMEDRDACKEVLKNVFVFKTYIFPLNSTCMQKGGSSQGDYFKVMYATQIVKDNFFCLWLLTCNIFLRKTIRNTRLNKNKLCSMTCGGESKKERKNN